MQSRGFIWMKNKTRLGLKYGFAVFLIIAGLILMYLKIGEEFLGFSSVGSWLIYVGFVMLAIIILQLISNKKRIVDERMEFIATKAARITFLALIIFAFLIMIIDGIKPITIPYSYFMSYLISGIVFIYFISYQVLLKRN
jgi:hypothetical protein